MNNKYKKILQFAITFILVFGSYLFFHIIWDFNQNYGFISATFTAGIYIMVGIPLFFTLKNNFITKGILWGVISIIIFLFSYGGCGVLR